MTTTNIRVEQTFDACAEASLMAYLDRALDHDEEVQRLAAKERLFTEFITQQKQKHDEEVQRLKQALAAKENFLAETIKQRDSFKMVLGLLGGVAGMVAANAMLNH